MNQFDKALAIIAPKAALRRMQYRYAAMAVEHKIRKYEGASTGRRTSGWGGVGTNANAETSTGAIKLRDNARDLERNNAWASKALTVLVSNTVGTGIRCQPKAKSKGVVKKASELWLQWAETTVCDWDGINDFYGLQALVWQTVVRDGEAIVRFRRVTDGLVPLQIQVLEPDFLDVTLTKNGSNTVIQGVEIDQEGRTVAYWLYPFHPGDPNVKGNKSQRVPADQVARVYRQDRAGQLRGVSWFAPIMLPLRDLDDYEDAQLIRQKIAACFAVFVRDANGGDEFGVDTASLPEKVEPGIIETLPAGKDISFASPPGVDGYPDYVRAVLRKIAAGLGIPYESLTGDLSQTNFSGGRMGWLEFQRNIELWRWRTLIPQLCIPVWRQFTQAASLTGTDLTLVESTWTPPRRELINPKDEILSMRDEIRAGLTSWSEAVRERGYDPDALIDEIANDLKRFDAKGLVLDCDPRKTTQQGQPVETPATGQTGG